MEFSPKDVDVAQVKKELEQIKGVRGCDDFHLWSIGGGKNCLTAHLRLEPTDNRPGSN